MPEHQGLKYEVYYCDQCKAQGRMTEPIYTLNKLQEHLSAAHPTVENFKCTIGHNNGVTKDAS